jgi:hypothetical protein
VQKLNAQAEEQLNKVKIEAQRLVKQAADERDRLQSAMERVKLMTAEYRSTYDASKLISVEEYETLVQIVLTRDNDLGKRKQEVELQASRYNAQVKQLVCGEFEDAANGLIELLQCSEDELYDKVKGGLPAMLAEAGAYGNAEVSELYDYVINQPASAKQYPNGVRDEGREGMRLADFMAHEYVKIAKLTEPEVAALRLYTTIVFLHINAPMRDRDRINAGTAHPLAVTVEHLTRALKKLRRIDASKASATENQTLWRGMKEVAVTEQFSAKGGTELSPMSTSGNFYTAIEYAMSGRSLVFCLKTKNKLQRGVELSWVSAFPNEEEILFPPLTYLQPTGQTQEVEIDGMHFTFVEVEPTIAA